MPSGYPLNLTPEERRAHELAKTRAWQAKNRDKALESGRKWWSKNKDKKVAYGKEWRRKNSEYLRAKKREWTRQHPGSNTERAKRWRENNLEKAKASAIIRTKKWQEANSDRVALYKFRAHERRRLKLSDVETFTVHEWSALLDTTGHKCVYCGIPEAESIYRYPRKGFALRGKLTVDHVIPLSKGGKATIDNVAPACLTCNMRKHAKHPKIAA